MIECAIDAMVIQIEEANDKTSSKRWPRDIFIPFKRKIGMTIRRASEIVSAVGFHWHIFMDRER